VEIFNKFAFDISDKSALPRQYSVALFQLIRWGDPGQACAMLQRTYQYEPGTMTVNEWRIKLDMLKDRRKRMGFPDHKCLLEGLADLPWSPGSN
jgi:hypothetical protein